MKMYITAILMLSLTVAFADTDGYHPDVGDYARIIKGREHKYPFNFGPTGSTGWFYEREFVINGVDRGSPADGILKIGDRIRAVNGRRFVSTEFKDDESDPRRALGYGITEAEAGDGTLIVTVWRQGREQDLTIRLPVMGSYSNTWPYNCKKSARILKNACQWLADNQLPTGAFVENCSDGFALGPSLNGLLLLSSGDPAYLENARRLAYDFVANPGPDPMKGAKTGTDGWGWSYQAMFVAEYYLRTGDTHVLPYLQWLRQIAETGMGAAGGWGHGYGHVGGYAVGGYINPVGVMMLNAIVLINEAGIEGDPSKLELAANYFRRWSYGGRGIHYGDHFAPHTTQPGNSGTGKNVVALLAFEVLGERDTAERFAVSVVDSYRHRDKCHTGPMLPLIWGPIGASRGSEAEFRMFMDYWTWFHDLSRRWDGSFLLPSNNGGSGYTARGPVFTMGGQALVYALPLKKTRACGATESPFAAVGMPDEVKPVKAMVDRKDYRGAARAVGELLQQPGLSAAARSRAALMQESIATTLESVAWTLDQIEENLASGSSVLARTRIANLEALLGKADGRLAELRKASREQRHDRIAEAWQTYLTHRLPSIVAPESTAIMERLAKDPGVGFVRDKAQKTLADARDWPTYRDSFCSESVMHMYRPAWSENNTDPLPLAVMRLLSFGDGILWTSWATRTWLEDAGLLGDFPFSTTLTPASDAGPAKWSYRTMEEPVGDNSWCATDFDDSAWAETEAPLLSTTKREQTPGRQWDKSVLLIRRTFDVETTDLDALRIKGIFQNETDIYLNGQHVARVVRDRKMDKRFIDLDITSAGLPVLRKGRNVLAAKSTRGERSGGHIDIGLLGIKR